MNRPPVPIELAREANFALGQAEVCPSLRQFTANGIVETIEPRVMQVLVSLARRAGEVVARDELVASCWDGRVVGEDAIQRAVAKVRKLGETSGIFTVETIPKVGYRLIARRSETRPAATPPPGRSNLPRRIEELIGRDEDLAQVAAILRDADLVTITGAGGIGKTRLAYEVGRCVADRHEDGVWLIELAALGDPALVAGAVARTVGVHPLSDPADAAGELLERLKAWSALLVLDSCEHLVEAVAALAEAILRHAPRVKLLVTSQEPLGVEGERVSRLRSLSEADAAQLFATRARAADAGFAARPADIETIRAICARLDGIPLAIEMAAARAPALGCEHLLALLDDRFRVLTGGRRTALPRQRTLRATLEWSHSLLSENEAAVFRRLGIFMGGFGLEAACEVASGETIDRSSVIDALASLAAKSLLVVDNEHGRSRYHLLETTRAYAQERLAEAREVDTIQRGHPAHFAAFLEASTEAYMGELSDQALLARYGMDIDNMMRGLEWAFGPNEDADPATSLAAKSATALGRNTRIAESGRWGDLAEKGVHAEARTSFELRLLGFQSMLHALAHRGSALDLVERNLSALRDSDDARSLYSAFWAKAFCLLEMGRFDEAEPAIEQLSHLAEASSRMKVSRDYLACLAMWARAGAAAARPHFDAVLAKTLPMGHGILQRIVVIEGSSSVAPQDDPDTAIPALRALLAEIAPTDANGGYLKSLCAARLIMLLGLRAYPDDIAEACDIARRVERTRSEFVDFRYALAFACVALGARQHDYAARIAGLADLLRRRLQANFWFAGTFADLRAALLRVMSDDAVTRLWSEGATMTVDEALALAIGDG